MSAKNIGSKTGFDMDRHFIFIEAPVDIVGPAAVFWGEAAWWPRKVPMRFVRTGDAELGLGATYDMTLLRPFKQTWKVEVTRFEPNRLVERTFRKGFFIGSETVVAEERSNGTRVEYELRYSIPNPFNKFFWKIAGHKMHDANILRILGALKDYCMAHTETHEEDVEEGGEA